jgi:hypothetical protein
MPSRCAPPHLYRRPASAVAAAAAAATAAAATAGGGGGAAAAATAAAVIAAVATASTARTHGCTGRLAIACALSPLQQPLQLRTAVKCCTSTSSCSCASPGLR